jgi:phage regulator Rha-like protein
MPKKAPTKSLISIERVERKIYLLREEKVMLDSDLAELYGVSAKRLNEQVKRNRRRFPDDFMFQLTAEEAEFLRSQIATLKTGRGQHRKYRPYAFTEHGAVMLASVLNSPIAVAASIQVVRAFVRLRAILATHKDLARKLAEMEQKYGRTGLSRDPAALSCSRSSRSMLRLEMPPPEEEFRTPWLPRPRSYVPCAGGAPWVP